MPHHSHYQFSLFAMPKDSPAIKVLSLWFSLLVFFFSPEVVHAEFLDRLELINHLRQGHYQKLEQILTHQEHLYRAKKIPEEHIEAAYFAFANSASDLKEKLNEWVTRKDKNGTALLARGIYYWNIGWLARGGGYMSKTPTQRVSTMTDFFTLSWQDLKLATKYKSTSGIPYAFIINIAMALGDREGVEQYTLKGLNTDPRSFAVRWKYLYSQTPWWSSLTLKDSLAQTTSFLQKEVVPFLDHNSDLRPLLGVPDYIRAEMLQRNGDREQSLTYYQKALKQGSYYWITYQFSEALSELGRHEEALEMINQALALRPQVADVLDEKARILANLKNPQEAFQVQADAVQFNKLAPNLLWAYGWRLKQLNRMDEAEEVFILALTYGSNDHGILDELGRLYLDDLNDPARALPYLKKAIRLNPQKPSYWLKYGWALTQLEDCHAIEALQQYHLQCKRSGTCNSDNIKWAQQTSQCMIWIEGCWLHHPTLKRLARLVKSLTKL